MSSVRSDPSSCSPVWLAAVLAASSNWAWMSEYSPFSERKSCGIVSNLSLTTMLQHGGDTNRYPGISADASSGHNQHLPRLVQGVCDFLQELVAARCDMCRRHLEW